jgi:hypothetical protein
MRRRRVLALLALAAALVAVGATAELEQAFGRGAFAQSAADATSPRRAHDSLAAPSPPPHPSAVGRRGARGSWLDQALRTGATVLAAAALLAALAYRRLGTPTGARRARSYGTGSRGRAPPQLLAT